MAGSYCNLSARVRACVRACVRVSGWWCGAARRPALATLGYSAFTFGQVFDAAVVAPNKLDLGGTVGDMPTIASWSSTAAWTSGLSVTHARHPPLARLPLSPSLPPLPPSICCAASNPWMRSACLPVPVRCCASGLVWLKQLSDSWLPLLLAPLALRLIGTWGYMRHCTMRPVREYLQVPLAERRQYLLAQEEEGS